MGEASRQATGSLGGRKIDGLAICSTSGTVLLADDEGTPLTPALMYDDGRAEEEASLAQQAGGEVWASLGYEMRGSFALPRLLWLLRSGGVDGAARLLHSADFVASRLAGEPVATDWSHALKTGYDRVRVRMARGGGRQENLVMTRAPQALLPPPPAPSFVGTPGFASRAVRLPDREAGSDRQPGSRQRRSIRGKTRSDHRDDPQVRLSTAEVMTVPLVNAAFFSGNIDKTRLFLHEYGYTKEMISKSRLKSAPGRRSDMLTDSSGFIRPAPTRRGRKRGSAALWLAP